MRNQIFNVQYLAQMSLNGNFEKISEAVPGFVFVQHDHAKDHRWRNYIVSNAKLEATGWAPHHL